MTSQHQRPRKVSIDPEDSDDEAIKGGERIDFTGVDGYFKDVQTKYRSKYIDLQ